MTVSSHQAHCSPFTHSLADCRGHLPGTISHSIHHHRSGSTSPTVWKFLAATSITAPATSPNSSKKITPYSLILTGGLIFPDAGSTPLRPRPPHHRHPATRARDLSPYKGSCLAATALRPTPYAPDRQESWPAKGSLLWRHATWVESSRLASQGRSMLERPKHARKAEACSKGRSMLERQKHTPKAEACSKGILTPRAYHVSSIIAIRSLASEGSGY